MSVVRAAKTQQEFDIEAIVEFKRKHEGSFRMEQLATQLLAEGWAVKIPSPKAVLTRRLKTAARQIHHIDQQKRKVRTIIAAKVSKMGPAGEQVSETLYDHIN